MTKDVDDLLDLKAQPVAEATYENLASLAQDQMRMEDDIAAAEATLKGMQEELNRVADKLIPEIMNSLGAKKFTFSDGSALELQEIVSASIPKITAPQAHAWLREKGHGDLIKNEVSVSFGAGEEDQAKHAVEVLKAIHLVPEVAETIHASTLKAFVREQRKQHVEFPAGLINVWEGQRSKITRKKK